MNEHTTNTKENLPLIREHYPIVAIGGSAGGLEAMIELLNALPGNTDFAYVYIQHLDRDFESKLSEILQRHTEMLVLEATDLLPINRNHLYVIPPDKDLSIIDGVIKVSQRPPRGTLHLPIDNFFKSLAEKRKEGSIGVVLSGNASDGALGLKAIKMAGGFTFVQDESAKYRSMPAAAIAEGVVDAILPPREIAKELEHLSRRPHLLQHLFTNDDNDSEIIPASKGAVGVPAKEEDLTVILSQLYSSTGVDFTHYKDRTIRRRILRRMLLYKLESLEDYIDYIKKHPKEIDTLYADLLINVTHFFRDEEATGYLAKKLLPKILRAKSGKESLRIWIAACSTGEEVYSMAIILLELLENTNYKVPVHIFATDLSEMVIAKARTGTYSVAEVASIPENRLKKYFTRVDGHYRVSKQLRDICVFAPHNIFKDPPFSKIDIVSCCNLLIYLDNVLQKTILSNFYYALNPSSYLILGKSEAIGASASLYTQLDKNSKIFQKNNGVMAGLNLNSTFQLPMREKATNNSQNRLPHTAPQDNDDIKKSIDDIFLTKYTLPGIIVNSNMDIVQFRGDTASFLQNSHGNASLNLLKMSVPGLSFELKSGVSKVLKSAKAYKKSGIALEKNGIVRYIDFEITPVKASNGDTLLIIVFYDEISNTPGDPKSTTKELNREKKLEGELSTLRNDMRSVIEEQEAAYEELQAANEEILSSNEELQSLNEELETSKEEIEASNEELLTINYELNTRNEQLAEVYEYNNSIFTTIRESLIILDKHLRVKTANKAFYETFKVSPEETEGRLIYEIGNKQWDIQLLRQLLENIIPEKENFEGYVVTHAFDTIGEKIMLLNARKVNQKVHSDEVILLAIEDITEHKKVENLLKEREGWLRNMTNNVPVMIWVSGTDKRFTFLNDTWQQYTGDSLELSDNLGWVDIVHAEDLFKVLEIYNEAYATKQPFKMDYRMKRADKTYRWVTNHAVPSFLQNEFTGFIGSCVEIHDERKLNVELESKIQERTTELQQLNKDLEQSNSELLQFAFVASHDLQEPLRKVTTFTNRIKEHLGDSISEKVAGLISKTITSTERMRHLIDDVLNYSKMSRLSGNFIPTDLNDIVQEVLVDLELLIEEKNASVTVTSLPTINAIPLQINQLFYNLLQNALKFGRSGEESTITISSEMLFNDEIKNLKLKEGLSYHLISVKDNGIGFNPDFSEHVFEIFQRLNKKSDFGGTGIGLALCRKIVNNHGGMISAESEEGKGAEFKIILPAW